MDERHRQLVHFWIAPSVRMPWAWDEAGEALRWGASTIAMRAEIESLIQSLAPGGLPPFGACALLLAACRDTWSAEAPTQFAVLRGLLAEGSGHAATTAILERVRARLDAVAMLPPARRATTPAKLALLLGVRDRAGPASSHESSAVIAAAVAGGIPRQLLRRCPDGSARGHLAGILACLDRGLASPEPARLELVERTGLEELPTAAPCEAGTVRALLAAVASDRELAGVAALARRLLAAVHLPRPLADPDDLQVGGVSDLSHRGSPDRLLVGELANDDLVLAARIATGEALYLRRETPPRAPMATRSLLVDAGMRMWGLPRVFATAVALALAATAPPGTRVRVWRASGTELTGVDLASRDGLVAHLAALAPEPHPGAALAAWGDQLGIEAGDEAVLVTHPRTLADPGFRRDLAATGLGGFHVACVDAAGNYRLLALAGGLAREVQTAAVDLDVLLRPPGGRMLLRREAVDEPLIYRVEPFPLLLPHPVDAARSADLGARGVLAATHDGRLTLWADDRPGARQLSDLLPQGEVLWVDADDTTAVVVIRQRAEQRWILLTTPIAGGASEAADLVLPDVAPTWFGLQGGALLAVWPRLAMAFSLEDGRRLGSLDFPVDAELRQTRFVVAPAGWSAVAWDGERLALVEVCKAGRSDTRGHYDFAFVDRIGGSGPWGFTTAGDCIDMGEGEEIATGLPPGRYRFLRASRDGNQLLVADAQERRWRVDLSLPRAWELRPGRPGVARHDRGVVLDHALQRRNSQLSTLMHSPLRLWRHAGSIALAARNRRCWVLTQHGAVLHWELRAGLSMPATALELRPDGAPERQRRAELRVGTSRFRCDARGLLHLTAADGIELSLVLRRGDTAAWCNDGRRCGPATAFADGGGPDQVVAAAFARLIAAWAAGLP